MGKILWVGVILFILYLVYDAIVYFKYGPQATASVKLFEMSIRHPYVPFFIGIVIGFFAGHIWPTDGITKLMGRG